MADTDRDPHNAANVAFVNFIFGGGSDTITALALLRKRAVSLFQKESVGIIFPSHVTNARAYHV